MSPTFDLLVIGDVNPDAVVHGAPAELAYGQAEQLATGGALTVGGSAGITACAAARLGLRTALAGVVGDDPGGRFMIDELTRRGVDGGAVAIREDLATGLTVALARGDDRAIVTYPGCIAALEAGMIDPALVGAARHVHVSSFFLQPRLAPGLRGLFEAARSAGATTSLDLNWDPAETWDGGLADVLPAVDVLFVNAAEAVAVSGAPDAAVAATVLAARCRWSSSARPALSPTMAAAWCTSRRRPWSSPTPSAPAIPSTPDSFARGSRAGRSAAAWHWASPAARSRRAAPAAWRASRRSPRH